MKRNPIACRKTSYFKSIHIREIKPRIFFTECVKCHNEYKHEKMYECSVDDDYFEIRNHYNGCSHCFNSKESFKKYLEATHKLCVEEDWYMNGELCLPTHKRMYEAHGLI